jgi:hypothetical protein
LLVVSIAAGLGCDGQPQQTAWLRLAQVRPQNHVGVFLNEKIQLDFSEPLDPTSVDRHSVRIADQAGTPARGELRVDEERLVFVPDPVLAFDLSDGGYKPGTTYFVELAGFPLVNGLRGRSGAPLEQNLRLEFRTVEVVPSRSDFVFEDSSPTRGLRVVLKSSTIGPREPLELEGEEPLDPSTLFGEDFVLQRELVEKQEQGRTRPPLSPPIPLRARMLTNFDRNEPAPRGTALIELEPVDRVLEPGRYWLNVDADKLRLRDFGGNRVKIWARDPARDPAFNSRLEITVVSTPDVTSWFLESFDDAKRRSFEWPEGFDGTARWNGSGRVDVHWPAAAFDGCDGEVRLGASELRRDVHATGMSVPEGVVCELDPAPVLVILRAQGKLSIAGELVRHTHAGSKASGLPSSDEIGPLMQKDQGSNPFLRSNRSLSDALLDAWSEDLDATVLIAGGDLVIDGRVDCDQPVLLVAGGRIRGARGDVVGARGLYYLGDGGDLLVDRNTPFQQELKSIQSFLEVDEPPSTSNNVLAAPLKWAVVSSSIPGAGRAQRWHVGPEIRKHDGIGAVRVRYIGERAESGGVREFLVDDPGALVECPTLRLRVELYMPGKDDNQRHWDPPWVDDVLLEFDRALPRGDR